jgi:hypothetical protein
MEGQGEKKSNAECRHLAQAQTTQHNTDRQITVIEKTENDKGVLATQVCPWNWIGDILSLSNVVESLTLSFPPLN